MGPVQWHAWCQQIERFCNRWQWCCVNQTEVQFPVSLLFRLQTELFTGHATLTCCCFVCLFWVLDCNDTVYDTCNKKWCSMIVKMDRAVDYMSLLYLQLLSNETINKHENLFCSYQFAKGIWKEKCIHVLVWLSLENNEICKHKYCDPTFQNESHWYFLLRHLYSIQFTTRRCSLNAMPLVWCAYSCGRSCYFAEVCYGCYFKTMPAISIAVKCYLWNVICIVWLM